MGLIWKTRKVCNDQDAGRRVYYPVYMVMFLKEDASEFPDVSVGRFSF